MGAPRALGWMSPCQLKELGRSPWGRPPEWTGHSSTASTTYVHRSTHWPPPLAAPARNPPRRAATAPRRHAHADRAQGGRPSPRVSNRGNFAAFRQSADRRIRTVDADVPGHPHMHTHHPVLRGRWMAGRPTPCAAQTTSCCRTFQQETDGYHRRRWDSVHLLDFLQIRQLFRVLGWRSRQLALLTCTGSINRSWASSNQIAPRRWSARTR
jgi:hypothetical protein